MKNTIRIITIPNRSNERKNKKQRIIEEPKSVYFGYSNICNKQKRDKTDLWLQLSVSWLRLLHTPK